MSKWIVNVVGQTRPVVIEADEPYTNNYDLKFYTSGAVVASFARGYWINYYRSDVCQTEKSTD